MKKILPMGLMLLTLITAVVLSGCASAEVRAVRSGDIEGIREYINSGGDVNAPQHGGTSLLMIAARAGQVESALLLMDYGARINARDNNGRMALMYAVGAGQIAMIETLLNKGAEIDARDNGGATALIVAAAGNRSAAAELLLARGADIAIAANGWWTALFTALNQSARAPGGLNGTTRMLIDAGSPLDVQADPAQPIAFNAAANGNTELPVDPTRLIECQVSVETESGQLVNATIAKRVTGAFLDFGFADFRLSESPDVVWPRIGTPVEVNFKYNIYQIPEAIKRQMQAAGDGIRTRGQGRADITIRIYDANGNEVTSKEDTFNPDGFKQGSFFPKTSELPEGSNIRYTFEASTTQRNVLVVEGEWVIRTLYSHETRFRRAAETYIIPAADAWKYRKGLGDSDIGRGNRERDDADKEKGKKKKDDN